MNSWDLRAVLPSLALLVYAVVGELDWPLWDIVLWGLVIWFAITAATGVAATYASAKDDAEIHHGSGLAGQRSSWAEILRDGVRLGAAPFLWLALASAVAALLGAEGAPWLTRAWPAALGAAILTFATALAAYAVHVRACERRLRAR